MESARADGTIRAPGTRSSLKVAFTMSSQGEQASQVLERNIEALLQRESARNRKQSRQQKLAASVTRFTGSLPFVYIHLGIVTFWTLVNAGLTPLEKFDPTFVLLA